MSRQIKLTMYPEEIIATEKALRFIVKDDSRDIRLHFTSSQWSELQDAWCRVFAELSRAIEESQCEND